MIYIDTLQVNDVVEMSPASDQCRCTVESGSCYVRSIGGCISMSLI